MKEHERIYFGSTLNSLHPHRVNNLLFLNQSRTSYNHLTKLYKKEWAFITWILSHCLVSLTFVICKICYLCYKEWSWLAAFILHQIDFHLSFQTARSKIKPTAEMSSQLLFLHVVAIAPFSVIIWSCSTDS